MTKTFPKIEIENIGDEDSNFFICTATRDGQRGFGQSNDSLKAREKAVESLEKNEKSNWPTREPNGDRVEEI